MAAIDAEPFLAILEQQPGAGGGDGGGRSDFPPSGRAGPSPPPPHLQPVGSEGSLHGLGDLLRGRGAPARDSGGSLSMLAAAAVIAYLWGYCGMPC